MNTNRIYFVGLPVVGVAGVVGLICKMVKSKRRRKMAYKATGIITKVITGSKVCIKADQTVKLGNNDEYNVFIDELNNSVETALLHIKTTDELSVKDDLFDLVKTMHNNHSKGTFTIEENEIIAVEFSNGQ